VTALIVSPLSSLKPNLKTGTGDPVTARRPPPTKVSKGESLSENVGANSELDSRDPTQLSRFD